MSIFDGSQPLKITKPIRLIECFAGYGSQALALKYLGVDFEHWKIAEWAVKSIQAYKDMHFPDDSTDYSAEYSKEWLIDYLFAKCISADYNKPMTREQIARMGEDKIRTVYNNIIATHNLVSVCGVSGKDLEIADTDKYDYILTYSFPCQDLSQAGLSKGMAKGSGTRSGLLWEIERILDECEELPQILLMENVPQVIGEKNRDAFRDWFMKLESLGYKSWYTIMNGKDYEIPQNRERCFMVSALGDYYYDFPTPKPLKLRLKNMLEAEVDEKYYLSDVTIERIKNWNAQQDPLKNIDKEKIVSPCITARGAGEEHSGMILIKCEQVGEIQGNGYHEMSRRVYGSNGLSPTVRTFCGCGQEIKIAEDEPRFYDYYNKLEISGEYCGTITSCSAHNGSGTFFVQRNRDYRIRKLTPKECFRLMGVKDEDFDRVAKNQSKSSLYHCAGDSIVTTCLMAIFGEMLDVDWHSKIQLLYEGVKNESTL
jgi:DNA (cytosine-5)-methyltransferase 1